MALLPGGTTKAPGPTALWTQSDPESPQAGALLWDFPPLETWGLEALLPQPGSFSHGIELGEGPCVFNPSSIADHTHLSLGLSFSVSLCAS